MLIEAFSRNCFRKRSVAISTNFNDEKEIALAFTHTNTTVNKLYVVVFFTSQTVEK